MVREFQEIESILGLTHSLQRIKWQSIEYSLIFESEEEKRRKFIRGVGPQEIVSIIPDKGINAHTLTILLETKEKLAESIIPMAFYREGLRDWREFSYINAFYNFYFILEGFYGGGKWKNYEIGNEFRTSELKQFVDALLLTSIFNQPDKLKKITDMLYAMNQSKAARFSNYTPSILDADGIIDLIIYTRGSLHHYSSPASQGTPFNQEYYKEIAFVLHFLAMRALLQKLNNAGIALANE